MYTVVEQHKYDNWFLVRLAVQWNKRWKYDRPEELTRIQQKEKQWKYASSWCLWLYSSLQHQHRCSQQFAIALNSGKCELELRLLTKSHSVSQVIGPRLKPKIKISLYIEINIQQYIFIRKRIRMSNFNDESHCARAIHEFIENKVVSRK